MIDHGASLRADVLGLTADPFAFIWFLAWWPWAIAHHLDPLFTTLVWQPAGLHLAWTTSVPLLALLGAPVTWMFGPIVTYNLWTLIAPAFSAFTAYLLCLRLTKRRAAAMIGGYLFGYSPYEMGETLAHLNLDFNGLVPLILAAALDRLAGRIGTARAVFLSSLWLGLQFYISVEVFATTIFFGAVAYLLALAVLVEERARLRSILPDVGLVGAAVAVLVSPLLVEMLRQPRDVITPVGWSFVSAAHLFDLLAPPPVTVLSDPALAGIGNGLLGLVADHDYTTGLPLILILILYGWRHRAVIRVRFLFLLLGVIWLAALGPRLWVGDVYTRLTLPWALMLHVPLISVALPVRFALYASLLIALLAALWLAERGARPWRLAFGLFVCLCVTGRPHPVQHPPDLDIFTPRVAAALFGAHGRLLILPGADGNFSALWQATSGFAFAQTQGYLGFPPLSAAAQPATADVMFHRPSAHLDRDIAQLCAATGTQYVVLGGATDPAAAAAMRRLAWPSRRVGGVTIFDVPPARLRP